MKLVESYPESKRRIWTIGFTTGEESITDMLLTTVHYEYETFNETEPETLEPLDG